MWLASCSEMAYALLHGVVKIPCQCTKSGSLGSLMYNQFCLTRKLQFVWEKVDEGKLRKMQRSFVPVTQQPFDAHTTEERGQGPTPMHQVWISGHPDVSNVCLTHLVPS